MIGPAAVAAMAAVAIALWAGRRIHSRKAHKKAMEIRSLAPLLKSWALDRSIRDGHGPHAYGDIDEYDLTQVEMAKDGRSAYVRYECSDYYAVTDDDGKEWIGYASDYIYPTDHAEGFEAFAAGKGSEHPGLRFELRPMKDDPATSEIIIYAQTEGIFDTEDPYETLDDIIRRLRNL